MELKNVKSIKTGRPVEGMCGRLAAGWADDIVVLACIELE